MSGQRAWALPEEGGGLVGAGNGTERVEDVAAGEGGQGATGGPLNGHGVVADRVRPACKDDVDAVVVRKLHKGKGSGVLVVHPCFFHGPKVGAVGHHVLHGNADMQILENDPSTRQLDHPPISFRSYQSIRGRAI